MAEDKAKLISYTCLNCGRKKTFIVPEKSQEKLTDKRSCVQCRKEDRINKELNRRGKERIKMVSK